MRSHIARLWDLLRESPRLALLLALGAEACSAAFLSRKRHLEISLVPNQLGVQEILASHHIHSSFLPVAYPALIGWAELLGSKDKAIGADTAALALQIVLLLLIVCLIRAILMRCGSPRFATTVALLIGLYPQFLSGVKKLNDANLTLLTLLFFIFALLKVRSSPAWGNAVLAGIALACAVLVRPNLILLTLLLPWSTRRLQVPRAAQILLLASVSAILFYAGVTTLVHGRPFFPRNGPYNLYAGYNSYTERVLRRDLNAENAIRPAMAEHGLHPHLDWSRQSDQPGVDDSRDEKYIPFYTEQSRIYIREHPGNAIRLAAVKLVTLLRQNYDNKDNEGAGFHKLAVLFKRFTLLLLPLWCGLYIVAALQRPTLPSTLLASLVILYLVPFVFTNADPRFRITIEGVILLDIARILYAVRAARLGRLSPGTPEHHDLLAG